MRKLIFILTVFAVLAALILVQPSTSHADGFFVAPIGSFMYEPVQQAYINYDRETGTEQLSILPAFTGDATAFAWVVPVPALPEVALEDEQLFRDLDFLTRPVYHSRDGDWDCFKNPSTFSPDAAPDDGGVDVVFSETVGYYQTLVLSATEAPALMAFLADLGFLHEDNLEATASVIGDYVDRSWYFVAMQVDSTALAEVDPYFYWGNDGYYGTLDPIRLTFSSDEIIYPMKISALSAAEQSKVHLYVKTDRRMTFPGATTYYANRFSSEEISGLSRHMNYRLSLQPGDFLTKLQRGYRPAEMTEDLTLVPAPGNNEFQMVIYSGLPLTGLLIFSVPLGIAAKRRFWIRRQPE